MAPHHPDSNWVSRSARVFARDFAILALAVLLLSSLGKTWAAERTEIDEYERKAKLLCLFLRATDWPAQAFHDAASPFVLGVFGKDPFGSHLTDETKRPVRNRPIVLKYCSSLDEAKLCHLVFVSEASESKLSNLLDDLAKSNILTVGESSEFTRRGGIVSLRPTDKRYLFELSTRALIRAGLKIDLGLKESGKLVN